MEMVCPQHRGNYLRVAIALLAHPSKKISVIISRFCAFICQTDGFQSINRERWLLCLLVVLLLHHTKILSDINTNIHKYSNPSLGHALKIKHRAKMTEREKDKMHETCYLCKI